MVGGAGVCVCAWAGGRWLACGGGPERCFGCGVAEQAGCGVQLLLPRRLALHQHSSECAHTLPCRSVREAFGEAYDEQAAVRAGKRQKRAGGASAAAAAAAAANDPTRARVEGILHAMTQPALAQAAVGADDVMREDI